MRWFVLICVFCATLIACAFALAFPSRASASTCLPWPTVQTALTQHYGEVPLFVGRGLQPGVEVAVYAAPQGTWTLIVRQENDLACILGAGNTWAMLDPTQTQSPNGTEN